jgi:Tol biopolymer transport system component
MRTSALIVASYTVALLACGGGDSGPTTSNQRLTVVGRLERGAVVRVVARGGASAADSIVSNVSVTPAGAAAVSGTSVRFLQIGSVTLSASASDGTTVVTVVDVAAPPIVYFDGVADGNRDVYSIALDGGDLRRLTTAAGDDADPTVAAGTLVFTTLRHGNPELYAIALASGTETRLTTTPSREVEPSLAAAGAAIAFVSDVSGIQRILVAPISLAGAMRLTPTGSLSGVAAEAGPTWSPTGDRIAFVSTQSGDANLYIAPATGGVVPTRVAGWVAGQSDVEPAWSQDGNLLAFASTRGGGNQIFLLDLRSGEHRQLTSGAPTAGQPGWLADGRLVFTTFVGSETVLWWIDPASNGGPVEILTAGVGLVAHAVGAR